MFGVLRRGRGPQAVLGIRVRWIDLLWGTAIAVLARFAGAGMNLLLYGTTGFSGQPVIGGIDAWYVFAAVVAPVAIAPLIEEGFFRGLMQGSLLRWLERSWPWSRGPASVFAVGLTAIVFVAVHLIGAATAANMLAVAVPLVVFAVAAGTARVLTERVGAAIVGHVVFNGLAVLLTWPW